MGRQKADELLLPALLPLGLGSIPLTRVGFYNMPMILVTGATGSNGTEIVIWCPRCDRAKSAQF